LSERIKRVRERFQMNGRPLTTVEKDVERITDGQLEDFCNLVTKKYLRAKIEPGKPF